MAVAGAVSMVPSRWRTWVLELAKARCSEHEDEWESVGSSREAVAAILRFRRLQSRPRAQQGKAQSSEQSQWADRKQGGEHARQGARRRLAAAAGDRRDAPAVVMVWRVSYRPRLLALAVGSHQECHLHDRRTSSYDSSPTLVLLMEPPLPPHPTRKPTPARSAGKAGMEGQLRLCQRTN